MSTSGNNGKGSKSRPIKNIKKFGINWDQINWRKKNPYDGSTLDDFLKEEKIKCKPKK